MQIQNANRTKLVNNTVATYKPAVEDDSGFLGMVTNTQKSDNGLDSLGPRAPMNVKLAWNRAYEQTGVNGLGLGDNGMMTHIPAALIVQAEQIALNGNSDIMGNSIDSAKSAAMKILDKLENPIVPETNSKIRDLQDQEKLFYHAFLNNLDEVGGAAYDLWKKLK